MKTITRVPNRLAKEKSPYLLQHQYNPVDWYPWSEEAFAKAKEEDKPIFLSIGYSTCHWCHVMSDESFDDNDVAEILNQNFVSVKVDREERPDVDTVYMNVCQALTGHGGWPLTIIMTPEKRPFYAGTYLPKHTRHGMRGLIELLQIVTEQWKSKRDSIVHTGDEIVRILSENRYDRSGNDWSIDRKLLEDTVRRFSGAFDRRYGGFGKAPKFPTPHNLLFLLRYSVLVGDARALEMVERTLEGMYRGGIFDHVGYGFSRYSTDDRWLVPHFEKMLYDNALLAVTYLEAYQATGRKLYKQVAEKVFQYISREMTSPEGAFYSAQDADSDGEEGKYYLLSASEVEKELGPEAGRQFNSRFGLSQKGNFNGLNIPNLIDNPDFDNFRFENSDVDNPDIYNSDVDNPDIYDSDIDNLSDIDNPSFENYLQIERVLPRLVEYRSGRYHLGKDDKILTSWNGLMIVAYAKAYQVLGGIEYLEKAEKAVKFIEDNLSDDNGTLYVSYRGGTNDTKGFLDDYAFMAWAYLSLYDATLDVDWLEKCISIARIVADLFEDTEDGGCYLYSHDSESLIIRPKETYDGAMPSGNSVIGYVLNRLSMITGNTELNEFADRQLSFLGRAARQYPNGHTFTLIAAIPNIYPSSQLVCVLPDSERTVDIRKEFSQRYLPNTVVLAKTPRNEERLSRLAPYTREQEAVEGKPTFYLCRNYACSAPTNSFEQVLNEIANNRE